MGKIYFLEAQGHIVRDNLIHQDNQSLIKLEQNGKASSGKRTRHIEIRYYFVTDRITGGDLRVDYCSTENILADFLLNRCRENCLRYSGPWSWIFSKQISLQRFSKTICQHIFCRKIVNSEISFCNYVRYEIWSDCNAPCPFSAWRFSVLFQFNRALVVLVQQIVAHNVAFCFQEILYPYNHRHVVLHSNELRLCRAFSI